MCFVLFFGAGLSLLILWCCSNSIQILPIGNKGFLCSVRALPIPHSLFSVYTGVQISFPISIPYINGSSFHVGVSTLSLLTMYMYFPNGFLCCFVWVLILFYQALRTLWKWLFPAVKMYPKCQIYRQSRFPNKHEEKWCVTGWFLTCTVARTNNGINISFFQCCFLFGSNVPNISPLMFPMGSYGVLLELRLLYRSYSHLISLDVKIAPSSECSLFSVQ